MTQLSYEGTGDGENIYKSRAEKIRKLNGRLEEKQEGKSS